MKRPSLDTTTPHRRLSRRALLLGGAQIGFMAMLGLRMRHLQVDQADQYRLLAEENRINIRLLPPERGEIFDRNGVPLAVNNPSYRITIVREDAGDVDKVIDALSHLVDLDPVKLDRARSEMARSAPFLPVTLA